MIHDKWLSGLTKLQRLGLPSFLVLIQASTCHDPFLPCLSMETSACGAPKEGKCVFCENVEREIFMFMYPLDILGKKKRLLALL